MVERRPGAKRLAILLGMVITCLLAAVANVIIARVTTINIFTMKVWLILPIGAALVGAAGASGAVLAGRYFNVVPTKVDFVLMVIFAAVTMYLVYYLDYITFVLDDGRQARDLIDFGGFVDLLLTKSHMRVGRGARDVGEIGQAGYWLAVVEFVGFLIGGAGTFATIRSMDRCRDCGSFTRRLKAMTSDELTFGEAERALDLVKSGDFDTIAAVIDWRPPQRKLDKQSEKARLTYTLHGCPNCKTEKVLVSVAAAKGKEWKEVPSLATGRYLAKGLSLREVFAQKA
jgi:hypothetical protein